MIVTEKIRIYPNRSQKDLSVRQHVCPQCGLSVDRDLNAAINILNKKFPVGTTGGVKTPMLVETSVPGVNLYSY